MIRWKVRAFKVALVLGAIATFAVASGAGFRWS
jgi:hypothetical protein